MDKRDGGSVAEEKVIGTEKYRLRSGLNFGKITNCQDEGGS